MKKFDISHVAKSAQATLMKHSPEILVGVGIVGMFTTVVMAVKATPKALTLMEEKKEEQQVEKLTKTEVVKTTWKCYIPAAITGALSTACIIGASAVNTKRNAALATAYTLSETALKEYRDKVIETIGEKQEEAVRDAIVKDKVEANPVTSNEVICTGRGETLCYDVSGGRYFMSDKETIRRIENDLNKRMLSEHYISLNEFYFELGLKPVDNGDELGWNLNGGFIDTHFTWMDGDKGEPCLALSFHVAPRYDYAHLM